MLATEILKDDHREVEELIAQLEEASGQDDGSSYRPIFIELQNALHLHMQAEEEIFYPAVKEFADLSDLVEESYDEHALVKSQLAQMDELDPNTDEFQDVLAEMKMGIEHHVSEEEGNMFPRVEEVMGEERLNKIGGQIEQLKGGTQSTRTASI